MKYTPLIGADMTGRLGAVIASKNRYGTYFREGAIPVNPQSSRQNTVRSAFQFLANRWSATLTPAERAGWTNYATAVPVMGKNGKSQFITGFSMFLRCNTAIFLASGSIYNPGPAVMSLPEADPTMIVTISAATQNMSVAFNNALPWANEANGHLLVHAGTPQLSTRNFFGGPHRYAGKVNGGVSPPTSPATIACPYTVQAGQKVWIRCRVSRADGRLSEFFRTSCNVGA
jgi:hypothetical protein